MEKRNANLAVPDPEFSLRGHQDTINSLKFHPQEKEILISG